MRFLYTILLAVSLLAASCNSNSSGDASKTEAVPSTTKPNTPPQSKLSEAGTQVLMATILNYYNLKDALVATNATKTTEAAKQLHMVADSLKNTVFAKTDSTNSNEILRPYLDTIATQSEAIAAANDPTCEKQRMAFDHVSSAIYGLLKRAEMKNAGVYHQYCPMAFNDKGAYWLSNISEIKNPYFGKKMLECGEVTDSL
jgi:Cu(I)/Ag(I) efflux system membrane fusion protein